MFNMVTKVATWKCSLTTYFKVIMFDMLYLALSYSTCYQKELAELKKKHLVLKLSCLTCYQKVVCNVFKPWKFKSIGYNFIIR